MYDNFVLQRRKRFFHEQEDELVKDITPETTAGAKHYMSAAYENADWAVRAPKVIKRTAVSGDNFWKGVYDHENAEKITETYSCPDPYAATEMEDAAIGQAVENFGMLNHYIIIRDIVNMDTYAPGVSPEALWSDSTDTNLSDDDSMEAADLFETSMKNNFTVGKVIIDAILSKEAGF